ncbi:MAG: lytic murein transglycosylase [Actinomycetota bacterium]|nr:lytic murein transglycosylase [Actinomycetota bacterium]
MPAAEHDDEQVSAIGAGRLGRHPRLVRQAAGGTIIGGILLFVVASVALPAGARTTPKQAPRPAAVGAPGLDSILPPVVAVQPADSVLTTTPRHVAKKAPATKAVISGLAANGIPNVALNAYRVAAARMANAQPGCGIDWALLAGIGREESDHGRFAGATLNADGTSTPRIIGIPLNGNGTEVIGDSDGGRIDGDPVYDRAAGPMQFIPSTWAAYGTDATGDGTADIFNINDAALTAARYLCAAGGNLRTQAGQVAAVLTYNHSDQYLAQVLALAEAYRTGTALPGIPVGDVTGGLPPVSNTGVIPPANPGPPTAVDHTTTKQAATKKAAPAPAKQAPAPAKGAPPATGGGAPPAGSGPGAGSGGGASGGTGTGTGGGSGTLPLPTLLPKPTPTPTPTKTCLVYDPLDKTKCVVWL